MSELLDLKKLEEFWNKAKEWGIFKHIQKLPDMLCHPRHFWQEYQLMSVRDKVIQFLTYGALFAVFICLASSESLSIVEIARIITLETVSIIAYVIIISLANILVKRDWHDLWLFVVFCCYTKYICVIPQLLALRAYYEFETPVFMGIAALIAVLTELMIVIYPAYIWQNTKRKILYAIFLSVLFLNLYDGFFIISGLPRSKSSNYDNIIMKERFELGKSIRNAYDIPSYVVSSDHSKDEWYLYSNPVDTVASLKFADTEQFIAVLSQDIDSLKAISSRCRFKTNREFFNEMYMLKRGILYIHETKQYKNSPIYKETDVMMDSIIIDRIYYRLFDKDVTDLNAKLLKQELKEDEQFSMAFYVRYLGALWHPFLFGYELGARMPEDS